MNTHHNNSLAGKAITQRAQCAHSFSAFARTLLDRRPLIGRGDHGVALPEAGDLIA
jgi:hypothetical protein